MVSLWPIFLEPFMHLVQAKCDALLCDVFFHVDSAESVLVVLVAVCNLDIPV